MEEISSIRWRNIGISILCAILFLFSAKFVLAAPVTTNCSGTAGAPTAVDGTSYGGTDEVTFSDTGGDGYCQITGAMSVASVVVESGVILTHPAENTTGINITTSGDFTLNATAYLNASKKGCRGGTANGNGFGPASDTGICAIDTTGYGTGNTNGAGGAGHAGAGGRGFVAGTGAVYDTQAPPTLLGSGGGAGAGGDGGNGGGLIVLNVTGTLTVSGNISTDGQSPSVIRTGGGSGGSINITAGAITGAGNITANGGNNGGTYGGGGGGGRVYISSDDLSGLTITNITANYGTGVGINSTNGSPGTTFILDSNDDALRATTGLDFEDGGDFTRSSLIFDDGAVLTCDAQATLNITATTTITDNGSTWNCSPAITTINMTAGTTLTTTDVDWNVTGASNFNLAAATWTTAGTSTIDITNAAAVDWAITNNLTLTNLTYTGSTGGTASANGGVISLDDAISVNLVNTDILASVSWENLTGLDIDATSSINADSKGCTRGAAAGGHGYGPDTTTGICAISTSGYGYGNSNWASGAGHGGQGGQGSAETNGRATYVDGFPPVLFGSGGGGGTSVGGYGGGRIYLDVLSGTLNVDGPISVNAGTASTRGGGGSGGSIFLLTSTLTGNSTISANGGAGESYGGGGGGGRINLKYADNSAWAGSTAVTGGAAGGSGTSTAGADGVLTETTLSVPDQPSISSPTEGAIGQSRNVAVTGSAYSSDGAPHLSSDWQVCTDDACASPVWSASDDTTNLTTTTVNTTNGSFSGALSGKTSLAPSTTYYIRTRYANTVGDSAWSDTNSFTTTTNVVPATPTNTAPADAAVDQSRNATLTGSAYSDPDSDPQASSNWYIYESSDCSGTIKWSDLADAVNLTSVVINDVNGNFLDDHVTYDKLKPSTQYSFKIEYTDDQGGTSLASSCTEFTTGTNNVPATPTNTAPASGATDQSQNPTLTGSAYSDPDLDAHLSTNWRVYDNQTNCTTGVVDTEVWRDVADTTNLQTVVLNSTNGVFMNGLAGQTKLAGHTTYYFRINYTDEHNGASSYSACTLFTTQNNAPTWTSTPPDQSWNENTVRSEAFDLDDYTTDPDSDTLTYTVVTTPSHISVDIDSTTHKVTFTPQTDWFGTETVSFQADDSQGGTATSGDVTLTVIEVNNGPEFSGTIPDQTIIAGSNTELLFNLNDYFTDPAEQALTFSASISEQLAVYMQEDGSVTMEAQSGYTDSPTVVFTATNEDGLTASSNAVAVTVTREVDAEIKSKKKGTGKIKIYDKNDNFVCQIDAWSEGGAYARLMKVQSKYYYSVIKYKPGTTMHLYDTNCGLVSKKKLSPRMHPRRSAVQELLGKKRSQELVVSTRRDSAVYLKIFRYNHTKDKWRVLRYKTFHPVPAGYTISANAKKEIKIRDKGGNLLYTWKVNEN